MARDEIGNWQKLGYAMSFAGLLLTAYAVFRKPPQVEVLPGAGPEAQRELDPGDHWLLVGDSIGVGVRSHLEKLSNDYGAILTSRVKIGTTISQWASQMTDEWGAFRVVVISLGSNDAVLADPESEMPALRKMVQHLRSHGASVFWLRPPSFYPGALKPKQQQIEAMFAEVAVPALDLKGPRVGVEQDPARLHPSPAGYHALAAQIFDAIT